MWCYTSHDTHLIWHMICECGTTHANAWRSSSTCRCCAPSFPGTKRICGNPSLFAGIAMIFSVNSWESVGNRIFVPRKGVWGRARVGKWALVMTSCVWIHLFCILMCLFCVVIHLNTSQYISIQFREMSRNCTQYISRNSIHLNTSLGTLSELASCAAQQHEVSYSIRVTSCVVCVRDKTHDKACGTSFPRLTYSYVAAGAPSSQRLQMARHLNI